MDLAGWAFAAWDSPFTFVPVRSQVPDSLTERMTCGDLEGSPNFFCRLSARSFTNVFPSADCVCVPTTIEDNRFFQPARVRNMTTAMTSPRFTSTLLRTVSGGKFLAG